MKEALETCLLVKSVAELHPKRLAEPWAKDRFVCRSYKLVIELNGVPVDFYFGVKKSFPLSLPYIFLAQWDSFGILPHVETDGYICYAQEDGSVLDFDDVAGIAQEALSRAIQVVVDGISGKNHQDFLDEFGAYWDRLKKVKFFTSIVSPGDQVKRIHLYKVKGGAGYLADDEQSYKKYRKIKPHVPWKHYPAIYIPLPIGTVITPPHPDKFWELLDIRKIVFDNLRADQKSELLSLLTKPHHEEVILLSLPRASDGETLFGIKFKGVNHEHPLHEAGRASEIIPLAITRRDKEYLLPRGGSNLALREKRVLLLGCGSVGGFIANELTRAGILRLTVLDKDVLTHENLFRHVLGKKHVGKNKVDGIKDDIEGRLPFVEVLPIPLSLENALESGKIKIGDFDLIISALGNVTVELVFSKYIHGIDSPPVIFTWLEPYGIGGHALLTRNGSKKGCLKCLYQPEDGDLRCRASFAEKGQSFAKNINGCRNVFTPFGSLDAMKTAELATRLAIATLNGDIKTNLIRSWRGDATEFLKNGKKLSSRYSASNDHFIEEANYHFEECPVCHEPETV
ncbi:E2/UBC family protein [Geotalea uraniireducens]|uniref:E2/UBC family protein n=1 Tax=Geotalea uraniireducens TaxID=351604 RepID=UPI0018DD58A2|nr:E2/UBC family protein [Geotalea uraniireducens]